MVSRQIDCVRVCTGRPIQLYAYIKTFVLDPDFVVDEGYSWIGPPVETHEKLIPGRIRRARTNPRHYWKALGEENPDLSDIFFDGHFLASYFLKQAKTWPQQKYTRQIWIRLVKYSCTEVSGSS